MNNEISENEVFIENPMEAFTKLVLPLTVTVFVFILVVGRSLDLTNFNGEDLGNRGFFVLIFFSCIFVNSLFFFFISLREKRIITCHSKGFDLVSTDYWKSYRKSESFLWTEISDSAVAFVILCDSESLVIKVIINQNPQILLSWNRFSKDAFDGLIQFINRSTPHLPYIWKKKSEVSTGLFLTKTGGYSKVART